MNENQIKKTIRKKWLQTTLSEMEKELGISREAYLLLLHELYGISNEKRYYVFKKESREGRHWSYDETIYLEDNFEALRIEELAYRLRRSTLAVQRKADKLFKTRNINKIDKYCSTTEIAALLNIHRSVLLSWVDFYQLPARIVMKKNGVSPNGKRKVSIEMNVFWEWLKENKNKKGVNLITSKINKELVPFYEVPKWFLADVENEISYGGDSYHPKWTLFEENQLLSLQQEGVSRIEIARKLNKSKAAIDKKLSRLAKQNRFTPM